MKPILKYLVPIIALVLSVISVGTALAADNHSSTEEVVAIALAAAPVAAMASFNLDNLKIPMEQYQELKAKYRHLYVIDINIDEHESYQFIVRRPSRDLLSAIASNANDITKANELILKNMVLAGDIDALDDGVVYAALMEHIAEIMKQGTSFLSKA